MLSFGFEAVVRARGAIGSRQARGVPDESVQSDMKIEMEPYCFSGSLAFAQRAIDLPHAFARRVIEFWHRNTQCIDLEGSPNFEDTRLAVANDPTLGHAQHVVLRHLDDRLGFTQCSG